MAQVSPVTTVLRLCTRRTSRGMARYWLVETLAVAVCGTLAGADNLQEIELWAENRLEWLREFLPLKNGIPSHDSFARLFGLMCPEQFKAAFRPWVAEALPVLSPQVVAPDGKTSRRSGSACHSPLRLVSVFAAGAGLILGSVQQRRSRMKKRRYLNFWQYLLWKAVLTR